MPEQIIVGIDASQNKLDVHVRPTGAVFSTDRDDAGLAALREAAEDLPDPRLVAIDATGGYEATAAMAGEARVRIGAVMSRLFLRQRRQTI